MISRVQQEMVASSVQHGVDRAPIPQYIPGIVMAVDATNSICEVAVDGSEDAGQFGADVLVPTRFFPGDRVMIMFIKPHGAYVVGRRRGDYDDWHIIGGEGEGDFNTGWTNEGSTGPIGTNAPAEVMFTKRSDRVELRGHAEQTSGSSDVIFTLPDGYRPDNDLYLPALGALTINTSIRIDMLSGDVARNGGDTIIILDGISFIAAAPVDIS